MNRRLFLTRALVAIPVIAAPAALLEALEPRRTIFLPPRSGWVVNGANQFRYWGQVHYVGYFHDHGQDSPGVLNAGWSAWSP